MNSEVLITIVSFVLAFVGLRLIWLDVKSIDKEVKDYENYEDIRPKNIRRFRK